MQIYTRYTRYDSYIYISIAGFPDVQFIDVDRCDDGRQFQGPRSPTLVNCTRRFFLGGSAGFSSPSFPLLLLGGATSAGVREVAAPADVAPPPVNSFPSVLAAGVSGGSPPRFLGTVGAIVNTGVMIGEWEGAVEVLCCCPW